MVHSYFSQPHYELKYRNLLYPVTFLSYTLFPTSPFFHQKIFLNVSPIPISPSTSLRKKTPTCYLYLYSIFSFYISSLNVFYEKKIHRTVTVIPFISTILGILSCNLMSSLLGIFFLLS